MRKKNAKDLHYEHILWIQKLRAMRDELHFLIKRVDQTYKRDILRMLVLSSVYERTALQHERKLAMAFKTIGISDYDQVFEDHKKLRRKIENLEIDLINLKALLESHHLLTC